MRTDMRRAKFEDADDPGYIELLKVATEIYGPSIGWRFAQTLWKKLQQMQRDY